MQISKQAGKRQDHATKLNNQRYSKIQITIIAQLRTSLYLHLTLQLKYWEYWPTK